MTYALIAINVAVFIVQGVVTGPAFGWSGGQRFFEALELHPVAPRWWEFFTYQFLHGGLLHIAGNMLFLWVFGPPVEDRLGRVGFLCFYLIGGAAAGGAHAIISSNPVIGASGSIACVSGAFLAMMPRVTVRVLSVFFIIGIFHIPAMWFILMSVAWDLFLPRSGVAVAAHLGGYAFGFSVAMALLWLKVIPRETYDLFSMGRQAHRRRAFREATARDGSAFRRDMTTRAKKPDDPKAQKIAEARARVSRAVDTGDAAAAGAAYRAMLDVTTDGALGRPTQLALGNMLYAAGDSEGAAAAYDHFLGRFGADPEAARVRLMLGLIHARVLNDPVRAKALVGEALPGLRTEDERGLARDLLEELG
mgnify:CR=1 FL=1